MRSSGSSRAAGGAATTDGLFRVFKMIVRPGGVGNASVQKHLTLSSTTRAQESSASRPDFLSPSGRDAHAGRVSLGVSCHAGAGITGGQGVERIGLSMSPSHDRLIDAPTFKAEVFGALKIDHTKKIELTAVFQSLTSMRSPSRSDYEPQLLSTRLIRLHGHDAARSL
jgi:hypothetical protein